MTGKDIVHPILVAPPFGLSPVEAAVLVSKGRYAEKLDIVAWLLECGLEGAQVIADAIICGAHTMRAEVA